MRAVDERLADGRQYLMGDHFTLSDMAFAVAAAPVVFPDSYGGGNTLPPLSDAPPAIRSVAEELRELPSGQLALRIYRERRLPRVQHG
jgi:glutathione S-transferase